MEKLTVAGSFSGTGGIELGFTQAGFTTVWANEIDIKACLTYTANFGADHLDTRSIEVIHEKEIPSHTVYVAGFPCQPFSHAGERLGFADARGTLFQHIARIVSYHKPEAFLLENVKGLAGHDNGFTLSTIIKSLTAAGYTVDYRILNAAEYGNVPQGRERIYIVGMLNGKHINWPVPLKLTRTPQDLLEQNVQAKYYYNHRYGHISEKINSAVVDDAIYQWRKTYVRRNQSGVVPTLTANMGTGGHNVPILLDPETRKARKATPRECFRFQGYPEDYQLPKLADSHLYKQAGNAVSVPVIKRIAAAIKETIQQE